MMTLDMLCENSAIGYNEQSDSDNASALLQMPLKTFSPEYVGHQNTIFIFLQRDGQCITMSCANEIKLKCIHIKLGSPCHLLFALFFL